MCVVLQQVQERAFLLYTKAPTAVTYRMAALATMLLRLWRRRRSHCYHQMASLFFLFLSLGADLSLASMRWCGKVVVSGSRGRYKKSARNIVLLSPSGNANCSIERERELRERERRRVFLIDDLRSAYRKWQAAAAALIRDDRRAIPGGRAQKTGLKENMFLTTTRRRVMCMFVCVM